MFVGGLGHTENSPRRNSAAIVLIACLVSESQTWKQFRKSVLSAVTDLCGELESANGDKIVVIEQNQNQILASSLFWRCDGNRVR